MKFVVIAMLFSLTTAAFAQFSQREEEVWDSISFGNIKVTADKVCHDSVSRVFKVDVKASTGKECVDWTVDNTDSTHPRNVCRRWETVSYPDRTLVRPDVYEHTSCVKYDTTDSTHPVCRAWKTETRDYPLTYLVMIFEAHDYRHESGRPVHRTIKNCL